jgi:pyruvate-ferredoxin/flavodoxin oxidoreductase
MTTATDLHEDAIQSGFWPLYRYNPTLATEGRNPLQLDSKAPTEGIEEFMYKQNRFRSLRQANPERAGKLLEAIRQDVITRWKFYEQMASLDL